LGPDFSLASRRKIRRGSPLDELPRLAVYRLLVALSLHLGGPTPPEHRWPYPGLIALASLGWRRGQTPPERHL